MKLIVGLGNPGEKYAKTRHNLGFVVLNEFFRKKTPLNKTKWQFDKKSNSQFAIIDSQLLLAKPQTMVNASGFAVAKLTKRYNLDASNLWVVHDDIDLILGKLKIRVGGASAGHRGVESIIKQLGTDQFVRFRLGVGRSPQARLRRPAGQAGPTPSADEVVEYVLSEFRPKEKNEVRKLVKKATKAIEVALDSGLEKAMTRFNQ